MLLFFTNIINKTKSKYSYNYFSTQSIYAYTYYYNTHNTMSSCHRIDESELEKIRPVYCYIVDMDVHLCAAMLDQRWHLRQFVWARLLRVLSCWHRCMDCPPLLDDHNCDTWRYDEKKWRILDGKFIIKDKVVMSVERRLSVCSTNNLSNDQSQFLRSAFFVFILKIHIKMS